MRIVKNFTCDEIKMFCLTILPESQAKMYHDINWFRLTDEPTWKSCLIYLRNRPLRKAGRDFIDLAVEQVNNIK